MRKKFTAKAHEESQRKDKAQETEPWRTFERLRGLYSFLLCKNLRVTGS
jgi:hypothetical protein